VLVIKIICLSLLSIFVLSVTSFQKSFSVGDVFLDSFHCYVSTILNTDKNIAKRNFEDAEKCLDEYVKCCLALVNINWLLNMDKTWLQNEYILNFDFKFYDNNFLREFSMMRINYRLSIENCQESQSKFLTELYRNCYYELCKGLELRLCVPFGTENQHLYYATAIDSVIAKNRTKADDILRSMLFSNNSMLTSYQKLHLNYIICENNLFAEYFK